MPDVLVVPDPEAVAETAAEIFIAAAAAAVESHDRFVVALSGGSTPRRLHALLAEPSFAPRVDWDGTWVVFGDERCVPPDHPDSNYRSARDALLDHVPIPANQVLRMEGESSNPARAAHFYETALRELFPDQPWPRLDLVLLGVGPDGHTASLFPGTDALAETERWVTANYVPGLATWRITLTLPVLNAARQILFLVTGREKSAVVAEAFGGVPHEARHPCEDVRPRDGQREVLIDEQAASAIPPDAR